MRADMGKRKWITANRVAGLLYWYCPGKGCSAYKEMIQGSVLPHTFHCNCGSIYIVEQVGRTTSQSARILIEVKK
jgi:hypothetical protein